MSVSSGNADFIGNYRVLEVLGRGGMGEVLLAWDERLQRRVAIKRIRQDGEVSPTLRQRLLREAQAVASLSDPAIVHVYELLKDDAGDDCIVMEYVEGRTVAAALEDGPLDPLTAVHLATEIASGLATAHEAGIVHRDLKAENVIVTPTGHAKILDFGLAKPLVPADGKPTLTTTGLVLGTCRSMSPEQAKGAEVDGRSDLFSLGVLLYEMLTGQAPFRGSGALEILTQVISKDPPRVDTIRPAVPPRLGNLIERLLEKQPASRPHSAAEVVHELKEIEAASSSTPVLSPEETIRELPPGYPPVSSPPPSHPQARTGGTPRAAAGVAITPRQRWLRIALLSALGIEVLVIVVALIWWPRSGTGPNVSDHPRPLIPKVSDRAHRTFHEIVHDIPTAEAQDGLARLTALLKDCPNFLDAQLLAADMNLTLYESTQQSLYRKRAEILVQKAQDQAPRNATQPLFMRCKVELVQDDPHDAEATFEQLQKLSPRDPQLLLLSSKLAERQGKTNEALEHLQQLVNARPSWQYLYLLADLEARSDKLDAARSHLERILFDSPGNIWAHEKRAEIELFYGDPKEAALRYQVLIDKKSLHRPFYTNLGNALFLLGRYKEALDAFEQARAFRDDNVAAILNVADAELALGNGREAGESYRKVLNHLDRIPEDSLAPDDQAVRAQCLAHLGQLQEAKTAIKKALDRRPKDGNILQSAALVYAVMGEKELAIDTIGKAVKNGIQFRWFQLPAYDRLKDDPEYKRLMKEAGGHL